MRGCNVLLDAIGKTLMMIKQGQKNASEEYRPGKINMMLDEVLKTVTAMDINTDLMRAGEDNVSRKIDLFDQDAIRKEYITARQLPLPKERRMEPPPKYRVVEVSSLSDLLKKSRKVRRGER